MVHYNESRRHRLNFDETPLVYALVSERLHSLLMDHKKCNNVVTLFEGHISNLQMQEAYQPPEEATSSKFGGRNEVEDEGLVYGEAGSLFRLLWRMDHNRPGKPEYPDPITWTLLGEYLDISPKILGNIKDTINENVSLKINKFNEGENYHLDKNNGPLQGAGTS